MPVQGQGKFLSAAILFRVAKTACERLHVIDSSTSGGQDDALVSIVFSAASIEAFFNELPELLSSFPELLKHELPQVPSFVGLAHEIETNKGSIKLKYLLAYSILSGQPCNQGGQPYQNFSLLVELRNGLMHMKPSDFSGEAQPDGTLAMEPTPRTKEKFRGLGIMDTSQPIIPIPIVDATQTTTVLQTAIPLPWIYRIATRATAYWAYNTVADVVDSILKVVPEGPHKPGLLELCKGFKRMN